MLEYSIFVYLDKGNGARVHNWEFFFQMLPAVNSLYTCLDVCVRVRRDKS